MFEIEEARQRAQPYRNLATTMMQEIETAYQEMRMDLHRQISGQWFIPIKVRPRVMPQKYCPQGMLGRMHDWEITHSPARPCWSCEGRLEVGTECGIESCGECVGGWVPERWLYKCRRCRQSVSKPGV